MFRKIICLGLAAVLVVLMTTAVGCQPNENKSDLTPITVCLDWTPNTNHTGLYVAIANGYYEEAGLDVTLVQPPENGAVVMCGAGQAQFAVDAQDTLAANFASEQPLGVTAVAALLQHNTSGIIGRGGEMPSPKALEGKRYSTWDSPIELAMLRHVVEKDGGDYDAVSLIPNVVTDEAAALTAGQTDAVWIYYGWSGINAELSGKEFDFWSFTELDAVFDYYTPVLLANDTYLAEHPDETRAFLAATEKGYTYAMEHPDEAAQMLIDGDTTGSLEGSEQLVKASQQWMASQYADEGKSWGIIDAARWDGFYDWLWEQGLIASELPHGTGFTNDYLPK